MQYKPSRGGANQQNDFSAQKKKAMDKKSKFDQKGGVDDSVNTQPNTVFHDDDFDNEDFSPPRLDGSSRMTEAVLNSAVHRLFDDATRRKELKERIQLLSAKRELEELRQQPEINKKTQKLLEKFEYIPIYERYEKIINDQ